MQSDELHSNGQPRNKTVTAREAWLITNSGCATLGEMLRHDEQFMQKRREIPLAQQPISIRVYLVARTT